MFNGASGLFAWKTICCVQSDGDIAHSMYAHFKFSFSPVRICRYISLVCRLHTTQLFHMLYRPATCISPVYHASDVKYFVSHWVCHVVAMILPCVAVPLLCCWLYVTFCLHGWWYPAATCTYMIGAIYNEYYICPSLTVFHLIGPSNHYLRLGSLPCPFHCCLQQVFHRADASHSIHLH